MGIEQLSHLEIVNGISTLIFIIISVIVGVRILLKYFSLKRPELLTIGLAWIFLSSAWWGGNLAFTTIVLTNQTLDPFIFLFMNDVFVPIAILCWIYSFLHIFYKDKEKIIVFPLIILFTLYEIVLITMLSIDTELVGVINGNINSMPTTLPLLFMLSAIATAFITGCLFSIKSIKLDDPELRLKGKFLLAGFISFTIAAVFDAILPNEILIIVILRVVLITSAIEYNLGFFLPKKLSNRIKKEIP